MRKRAGRRVLRGISLDACASRDALMLGARDREAHGCVMCVSTDTRYWCARGPGAGRIYLASPDPGADFFKLSVGVHVGEECHMFFLCI